MINFPLHHPSHVADCGTPAPGDASPRRATAPLPRPGPLEPRQPTRPPASREAGTSRLHADLPADLIGRIAERMAPADAENYARVDKATHQTLAELLALQRSQQRAHQQQLLEQVQQAATPEALLAVVQQIPALAGLLQAEPLEAAGRRLGKPKMLPRGEVHAAVFHAIWHATIALPIPLRREPLFVIAPQVAVLPAPERLAAMEKALAQMQQCPRNAAARYRVIETWTRKLERLPMKHHAAGLRLQHDAAGLQPKKNGAWRFKTQQFLPYQLKEFCKLLSDIEPRLELSPQDLYDACAARRAIEAEVQRQAVSSLPPRRRPQHLVQRRHP